MRPKWPYIPPPMIVSTEAALVLRTSRSCLGVWYVGWPWSFFGVSGNDSRISTGVGTEVEAMVLVTRHGGGSTYSVQRDLGCSTNEARQGLCAI